MLEGRKRQVDRDNVKTCRTRLIDCAGVQWGTRCSGCVECEDVVRVLLERSGSTRRSWSAVRMLKWRTWAYGDSARKSAFARSNIFPKGTWTCHFLAYKDFFGWRFNRPVAPAMSISERWCDARSSSRCDQRLATQIRNGSTSPFGLG